MNYGKKKFQLKTQCNLQRCVRYGHSSERNNNSHFLNVACGIYLCTGIYFFKLAKKGGNDFSPLPPLSLFPPNPSAHFIFLLFIPQHRTRLHHPPHRMTQCQSGNNRRKYHRCRSNNNSPRHRAGHSKSQARRSRCTPRHSR